MFGIILSAGEKRANVKERDGGVTVRAVMVESAVNHDNSVNCSTLRCYFTVQ